MITGYKVFNPDFTCRGYQYEVGQTYAQDGEFDFCLRPQDCFSFYDFDPRNRVAEVEALGSVVEDGSKSVTDKIRIVREIPWAELLEVVNSGYGNSGYGNSGYGNSGYGNSGYGNSGSWNSGDGNSGFFNRCSPQVLLFEKPTTLRQEEISQLPGMQALCYHFYLTDWVYSKDMTAEEKTANPQHETTGGFLRVLSYKEACAQMWEKMNEQERRDVMAIPNFDPVIFEDITGIRCSNCGAMMSGKPNE